MNDLIFNFFHKSTKVKNITPSVPPSEWPDEWKVIELKSYPRLQQIILPEPDKLDFSLGRSIVSRRSERQFVQKPISLRQLSNLLFYSAGIIEKVGADWNKSRRAYPSGGARYPLEIYPVIFKGEDVEKGIYHYNVKKHGLEKLLGGDYRGEFLKIIGQEMINEANFLLLISAVFHRTIAKYKDRGYRLVLIEAGHLGQNISLVSNAIDLKTCALGGFLDDKCGELLDIDNDDESIIYVFACG